MKDIEDFFNSSGCADWQKIVNFKRENSTEAKVKKVVVLFDELVKKGILVTPQIGSIFLLARYKLEDKWTNDTDISPNIFGLRYHFVNREDAEEYARAEYSKTELGVIRVVQNLNQFCLSL